ncbi:tRNA pseudouridine(55) synthase TruB [Oceanicola sp. 502str15]|uniref:tRNA pseudouridine(55) synthase TruB n=1 Tax=Oceanicola sp. 502str15 TaxID=2696061 RepID=UPI0020958B89|nr:tRNA pseudouridine(55) synthase TruB [Oceanicola sp. 502str15]MCO6384464.1 tRNA pseudouridine(55) synthase TruB [Oceanicola sp. 502str15]
MARRKGRDISGWIILDKPAGPTSTGCVNKLRWAFEAKKAGHSGTLDPAATGLLAIAFGEATKCVPYVMDADKCYSFTVRLGAATNTDDAEGEVIATSEARPSDDEIRAALAGFTGEIMQVPPKYSAVKIDGERAYALARDGEDFEVAARPLWVESLELVARPDPDTAELRMVCGKGGYVRSIARDLGEALGCLGHVLGLRREWSGPFDLEGSVTLEQVEALARTPDVDGLLLPLEAGLGDLARVTVNEAAATRIAHGNPAPVVATDAEFGEECWAAHKGQAIALGRFMGGEFHPARVLNR